MKKVAIIGAGFFGLTASLILSKKFKVTVFEKSSDILNQSSKVNQFRFHLGYHYPRSKKTVEEIKENYPKFLKFYKKKNIFGNTQNYYGIASKGSKISYNKFLNFLNKHNLYHKKNYKYFSDKFISGSVITKELSLNYFNFKSYLKSLIKKNKIKILFNRSLKLNDIDKFDKVIVTAYSNNGQILSLLKQKNNIARKYELIEKTIIKLPKFYKNKSFIVLDGKFLNVDPYCGTNFHLLSSNRYSKIETIKNKFPNFKSYKKRYCDNKIHRNINKSVFNKIIKNQRKYLPFLSKSKYIGSYFVVRTLSSNFLKNDERTTNIRKINNKFYTILGGKWNTCVGTALRLKKML